MSFRRPTQFHTQRRSKDSPVECRYCRKDGHVIRSCPTLARKEESRQRRRRAQLDAEYAPDADGFVKAKGTFRRRSGKRVVLNTSTTRLASFAALDVEEKEQGPKRKVVAVPKVVKPTPPKGSWARPLQINQDAEKPSPKPAPKPAAALPKIVFPKKKKISWADAADLDSDDESDDEDLFLGSY